ncbi:MAG: amidohydrolase [Clostridiales bacterium]|nr:amidohydrolase [Clostridiales bacterium]
MPIDELSHHSYRSVNPGVMHACGHDSHTAIILGLIESMAQNREFLMGDVIFIFQHAEETPRRSYRDPRITGS